MTSESTQLLRDLSAGDVAAQPRLIQIVYDELHRIAGKMISDNPRATLQATELIHEAWMRLVDFEGDGARVDGLRHYRRVAARAMRFVLVDRARARRSAKRGGAGNAVTLNEDLIDPARLGDSAEATIAVDEGLRQLTEIDPDLAQLVELRFFGGLTMAEIAVNIGASERSVHRMWRLTRAWWLEQFGDRQHE